MYAKYTNIEKPNEFTPHISLQKNISVNVKQNTQKSQQKARIPSLPTFPSHLKAKKWIAIPSIDA
jgi:hypothetical protein